MSPAGQLPNPLLRVLPLLVDAGTALVLLLWLPTLSSALVEPSGWNALLLVVLYLLFCSGVYLARKLLPETGRWPPPVWLLDPRVRGVLGLVFGLFMATTFAYQVGYFSAILEPSAGLMAEGSTSSFLVYAPGAWLGFSMLVILVLAFPVEAAIEAGGTRYVVVALLSLLLVNSLLIFVTAQTRAMLSGLHLTPGVVLWLLLIAAFTLSFFPARILYQSRQPHLAGWLSFTLLVLFCVLKAAG